MTAADAPLVLLVDADLEDCVQLGITLRRQGFSLVTVASLTEARLLLGAMAPALVITDRTLPDGDGLDLVTEVAGAQGPPFVIVLSRRADESDRLAAFRAGVDDYIAKPFSPEEVALRLRAMLRRAPTPASRRGAERDVDRASTATMRVGSLELDPDLHEVRVDSQDVALTTVEFQLLEALIRNRNVVLSRDQLIEAVWGAFWNGDSHALDVHMSNLRRKLSNVPRDQNFVRSVRGVGYRLGPCTSQRQRSTA